MSFKLSHFAFLFFATVLFILPPAFAGPCEPAFLKLLEDNYVETVETVKKLEAFAAKHNLPTQVIEVGPKERRVKRLVVGIDATDKELMQAYMNEFALTVPNGEHAKGTLAIEFQREVPGAYVMGGLRTESDPTQPIYRWGRKDTPHTSFFNSLTGHKQNPVFGFGHLLGLTAAEAANVRVFLDHPDLRAPIKGGNCISWIPSIELGTTTKEAQPEDRRHVFNELGVARTIAHFEIARRLMHATDQRHGAVVAFLNGEQGKEAFKEGIEKQIPAEPQIPYAQIIRGIKVENQELSKAMEAIPNGAKVFFPIAAGASPEGFSGLLEYAQKLPNGVDVHMLVNGISEAELKKAADTGKLRLHALFLGSNMRSLYKEGKLNVIPGYLSDFTRMMKDSKNTDLHYDAIVVRVAEDPYNAGNYSLGPNSDMIMSIIKNRPGIKIIAEINPNIPYTKGENTLKKDQITASFQSRAALAGPPVVPTTEIEKSIGRHLGDLVETGSTVQIGIGNIFGGFADGLQEKQKKDLKIWTEMFGDPLKDVMNRGIATSAQTGFAFGSADLYTWLNRNAKVTFESTEKINDPAQVAAIPNFHAINTALQVNLRGDVNATMGPQGRISSPGGQVEFMSGASRSEGGKAVIAIRSTAKNGELSTIVLDNYFGTVTTPSESVSHVVTEYGTARLVGKNEREKTIALINVAHPKFRVQLLKDAQDRKLLFPGDEAKIVLNQAEIKADH